MTMVPKATVRGRVQEGGVTPPARSAKPKKTFNFRTIHRTKSLIFFASLLIILGGKLGQFGGEASPTPPSLDETLAA